MPEPNPSRPLAVPVFDGLLIVGFLALTFALGCFRQKDMDIWWHLKTGELIQDRGEWPRKDWYTFTSTDQDWVDLHWLFQVAASKLYAAGGMPLLTLAAASLGTVALALVIAARRTDWSVPLSIACWLPALFLMGGRFYVRPEMVSLVCIALFLTVLFHADRSPWLPVLLLGIQVLWVNVQGLFILGPIIGAIHVVDGFWRECRRRANVYLARRVLWCLSLIAA